MMGVQELGARRGELMAELAEGEAMLHVEMRAMRTDGATLQEILAASGYRSIDGIRKILDPGVKRGAANARRRRRSPEHVARLV